MRAKVILTNLVIVALLGFACQILIKFMLTKDISTHEESRLGSASSAVDDLFRVHGYTLMMKADQLATRDETENVWELPDEIQVKMADTETAFLQAQSSGDGAALEAAKKARDEVTRKAADVLHDRAYMVCDKFSSEEFGDFEPWFRKPKILVLTTLEGTVIARDANPRELVGEKWDKEYPLIRWALNGRPRWDVVKYKEVIAPDEVDASGKVTKPGVHETRLLLAAAAPVYRKGKLIGSLFVGFDIDTGLMKFQKHSSGSEAAILYRVKGEDGKEFYKVYSSSFDEQEEGEKGIDAAIRRVNPAGVQGSGTGDIVKEMTWVQALVAKGETSSSFMTEVAGTPYLTKVSSIRETWQFGAGDLVYVTLRDQSDAKAPLKFLWVIAIGTAVAAILVVMLGLMVSASVLRPIEQLEAEVRTVIEGNWEHRWELKSSEVGGLSYLVNQMLDSLMEDEEEAGPGGAAAPGRPRATTEEEFMALSSAGEPTPEALAAEPEDQYFKRLYVEFQRAKQQLGEDPASVPFDQFCAKLRETERKILEKQPGRMVRFVLQVQGNKINYKPVHIA